MPAKHADLHKMLTGKLKAEIVDGGKHIRYRIYEDGRFVASTMLSRNQQEVSDTLLGQMARQLFVNNKQMRLLLDCPMTREEYIVHQSRKNR